MSSYCDYDDTCQNCDNGRCDFKIEKLEGHSKNHKVGTCKNCGEKEIVADCIGC